MANENETVLAKLNEVIGATMSPAERFVAMWDLMLDARKGALPGKPARPISSAAVIDLSEPILDDPDLEARRLANESETHALAEIALERAARKDEPG